MTERQISHNASFEQGEYEEFDHDNDRDDRRSGDQAFNSQNDGLRSSGRVSSDVSLGREVKDLLQMMVKQQEVRYVGDEVRIGVK